MKKSLVYLLVATLACLQLNAQKSGNLVVFKENGSIDWTEHFIEATGESLIDTNRWKIPGQAKLMAERGAKVLAQRNLLEIVQGAKVVGTTTVRDMAAENDLVESRIEGVVRGAMVVSTETKETSVIVTLRMPIYDQNGIAPIVHSVLQAKQASNPAINVPKEDNSNKTSQQTGTNSSGTQMDSNGNQDSGSSSDDEPMARVVLNVEKGDDGDNDNGFDPSMFPVFVDEDGNVILDLSKYYDPHKGEFLKYVTMTKEMLNTFGVHEGDQIINAVQNFDGNIKVDTKDKPKLDKWVDALVTVGKIASIFVTAM